MFVSEWDDDDHDHDHDDSVMVCVCVWVNGGFLHVLNPACNPSSL